LAGFGFAAFMQVSHGQRVDIDGQIAAFGLLIPYAPVLLAKHATTMSNPAAKKVLLHGRIEGESEADTFRCDLWYLESNRPVAVLEWAGDQTKLELSGSRHYLLNPALLLPSSTGCDFEYNNPSNPLLLDKRFAAQPKPMSDDAARRGVFRSSHQN
jgi:hypothetical protein